MTHQRHEEAKRERRRAERAEAAIMALARNAAASTKTAAFHVEVLHEYEGTTRALIAADAPSWDLAWRRDFIEGHAIRAIVAALRELLS